MTSFYLERTGFIKIYQFLRNVHLTYQNLYWMILKVLEAFKISSILLFQAIIDLIYFMTLKYVCNIFFIVAVLLINFQHFLTTNIFAWCNGPCSYFTCFMQSSEESFLFTPYQILLLITNTNKINSIFVR